MLTRFLTVLWLAALGLALHGVTARTWAFAKHDYSLLAAPPFSHLDSRLIPLITLGNRGLYDDVVYLWTLQTLVDPRLRSMNPEDAQRAVLNVTRHSPKIETLYMLSCFVMAFDLKRPELCEKISLDGLKAVPEGWRIPLTQGFIYAFELHDPKNAAMYYGLAASRPDAPKFAGTFAAKLVEKNELSVGELQTTLSGLLSARDGSRFEAVLEEAAKQRAAAGQKT